MSKSRRYANETLKLAFNGKGITGIADDPAAPLGNFYVSLHTSDPGKSSDQTESEATYGSYARIAVARTSDGWSVTDNPDARLQKAANASTITFHRATSGDEKITHYGIGTDETGAGSLKYSGELDTPLEVSTNIIVEFDPGALKVIED